ncbi:MAG: DUF1289 domain-containing protein [Paracoccaceae bacterium]
MSDEIWQRDEIDSPCRNVCVIAPKSALCIGCNRTRAEIAGWSQMTPDARRALRAELPTRVSAPTKRRKKRTRNLRPDAPHE